MNENLTYRIIDYLNQKTNYAVIISGKYGIGKSYYVDKFLFPEIQKIKIAGKEKFKTVKISLFGVSSIEEIERLILFAKFPLLNTKVAKVIGGIINGAAKFKGFDIDAFASLTPGELNSYEDFVICFDDIDRKSPNLDLAEVYGFVNNLVENKNSKVILIANEDILREEVNGKGKDNYSVMREKVIGISFPFKPQNHKVIISVLENYKDDHDYYEFLKSNIKYIDKNVSVKGDNLRNVIFFLEHFKKVFEFSKKLIAINNNLKRIKDEVLKDILQFALPIAFEYKLGKLNDKNLDLLKNYINGTTSRFNWSLIGGNNEPKEKDYVDEFIEQYEENNFRVKNFNSILNYVIGLDILDEDALKKELEEIYKTENANFSEKELLFRKLGYWQCVSLSPREYRISTKNLIKLIDEDKITLDEFASIFHLATRFENILNLNTGKLKIKIIRKIKYGNYDYVRNLGFRFSVDPNDPQVNDIKDIMLAAKEKNTKIKTELEKEKLEAIFENFRNNFDDFSENSQNANSEFISKPFFSSFTFGKLWSVINNLSNIQLIELGFLLEHRYRKNISPVLFSEKQFLESLKSKLEEKSISVRSTKIEIVSYKVLIEKIKECIENF